MEKNKSPKRILKRKNKIKNGERKAINHDCTQPPKPETELQKRKRLGI